MFFQNTNNILLILSDNKFATLREAKTNKKNLPHLFLTKLKIEVTGGYFSQVFVYYLRSGYVRLYWTLEAPQQYQGTAGMGPAGARNTGN